MDERFKDLIYYIDKRFEKQQNYMNKRFEDINKRFNFILCFFWYHHVNILSIITVFFGYISYTSQKQTDLSIQQLQNLQKAIVEQKEK